MNVTTNAEVQASIARSHQMRAEAFRKLFRWKIFAARPTRVVTA